MDLSFWAGSDVGKKRDHNEDNFLIDKKLSLFVVADGMGGHASGEVASHLAVSEIHRVLDEKSELLHAFAAGKEGNRQDILALLEQAVHGACAVVFQRGVDEPDKRGMGTTISALMILGERGFFAHVGDSRIYMVRQGEVVQLTEDHSLVNELIRRGKVTREGLAKSPYAAYKNAVTRAVGVYETVQVDTLDFDVLPGDQFLLCSDGLHTYVDSNDILKLCDTDAITAVPQRFIDHANEKGGADNITALIVRIMKAAPETVDARSQELTRKVEVLKKMPLFQHLTYKEIMRLLNLTEVSEMKAGQDLLVEGETGDELYILLKGKVRLHKEGAYITTLATGDHFGEMALIDQSPRSVSATAEERGRVLILRRKEFYDIIKKDPPLSVKLLWSFVGVLAERLRKTTQDLSESRQDLTPVDMSRDVVFDE